MATWQPGQPWRVVDGLDRLLLDIRAYAPRAVPPATDPDAWGALADGAHSANSDHYPHHYPALGGTAVVCARDFPNAPALGLDAGVVTEHMRRARDPRVKYIICNGRITGVSYHWQWAAYGGDDPHRTHFHVSSVHSSAADGRQPWSLPVGVGGGPDESIAKEPGMILISFTGNGARYLTDGHGKTNVGSVDRFNRMHNAGVPWVEFATETDMNFVATALGTGPAPTPVTVDAAAVAAALVADPALGALIEARAFAAAQAAEDS